ncbi:MAG: hypothetical protein WD991_01365 [Candidatus Paceibacterota bacterium]
MQVAKFIEEAFVNNGHPNDAVLAFYWFLAEQLCENLTEARADIKNSFEGWFKKANLKKRNPPLPFQPSDQNYVFMVGIMLFRGKQFGIDFKDILSEYVSQTDDFTLRPHMFYGHPVIERRTHEPETLSQMADILRKM